MAAVRSMSMCSIPEHNELDFKTTLISQIPRVSSSEDDGDSVSSYLSDTREDDNDCYVKRDDDEDDVDEETQHKSVVDVFETMRSSGFRRGKSNSVIVVASGPSRHSRIAKIAERRDRLRAVREKKAQKKSSQQ
eukprot:TRINITY_DN12267_c0_g1_i1.p1 TRINITY_DN12267_c0_g1~~TRINITY_DN12267_c0_g1_i1.p1  ORF type:complete len:134 (-),score=21.54 TRINITY_DN12267_c0_g1_i1:236-637(-)